MEVLEKLAEDAEELIIIGFTPKGHSAVFYAVRGERQFQQAGFEIYVHDSTKETEYEEIHSAVIGLTRFTKPIKPLYKAIDANGHLVVSNGPQTDHIWGPVCLDDPEATLRERLAEYQQPEGKQVLVSGLVANGKGVLGVIKGDTSTYDTIMEKGRAVMYALCTLPNFALPWDDVRDGAYALQKILGKEWKIAGAYRGDFEPYRTEMFVLN